MYSTKDSILFSMKFFLLFIVFIAIIFLWRGCILKSEKNGVYTFSKAEKVIILDPGHGGKDGGAVSKKGYKEKDLNLSLSYLISDALNICGTENVMTRYEDKLVCDENSPELKGKVKSTDLKNRLQFAEKYENAMFVSIHMNKFSIEKYKGLQVYYSPNNEESLVLAQNIQRSVINILQNDNTRTVKKADSKIYLLDRLSVPAVLVECGFLSNNEESENLNNPVYQLKLALVISDSLIGI